MDVADYNKNIDPLHDNLSKENKQVFLLGDLNFNLLNYNYHQPTNELSDSLASNSFIPFYSQPDLLVTPTLSLIIFSSI